MGHYSGFQAVGAWLAFLVIVALVAVIGSCVALVAYGRLKDKPDRRSGKAIAGLAIGALFGPFWILLTFAIPSADIGALPLTLRNALFLPVPLVSISGVIYAIFGAVRSRENALMVGSGILLLIVLFEVSCFVPLHFMT